MKILFLDAGLTMLAKNLLPIARYFSSLQQDFQAVFTSVNILGNSDSKKEAESLIRIRSNTNYSFYVFESFNRKKIEQFLLEHKPDLIFIGAYRIYDQLWAGIGSSLQIPTYKIMHGFEIDSVYYKPFSALAKYRKVIRMTYAIYSLSVLTKSSYLKMYMQYLNYLFHGKQLKETLLNNKILHPVMTFVFSDYYKSFWNKKFGFDINNMTNITPIDFLLIPEIKSKPREKACCYITQTIVEDGRMKKTEFLQMMKEYMEIASKTEKFYIKLHPQSNLALYDSFRDLSNVEITREFPNCTSYISHYSSLVFTASFISDFVLLHEVKGHKTPSIFKEVATFITDDVKKFEKLIKQAELSEEPKLSDKKEQIKHYAIYDDINPYQRIFETVMKDFTLI
jgi:hypothetical protein